jgi:hypothetical protein
MGLPAKNKFNKPADAAKGKAKTPPAKKKKSSRFAGEDPADRPPMLEEGDSRVRLVAIEEGHNPGTGNDSFKVRFQPVDFDGSPHSSADGEHSAVYMDTGRGRKEFKEAIRAFAGYDDEAEYDAFDPESEFFEAVLGQDNDFTAEAEQMIGRVADVRVTKGGATRDGLDWYRRYQWAAVADDDDDQNVSPKIEK